ncbi:4-oxalocrotonate tautomerase [Arthrobacter sp. SW1]|uniref:tautomerase family protein n=1 Tax=Arthrobacter sp. SW1 TaxID=1920889 RepID=UPI000877BC5C|nr:tautomerase family protein [Arthrobacter sp. SW1]OFI36729.1 4-oxalocrotonate tautomerase [Arthrobacter sp. SW1]
MAQFKIYGNAESLAGKQQQISDVLHQASVGVLGLPADKRFHRFIPLDPESFIYPDSRSSSYTIIEGILFEGREVATKKRFYRALFDGFRDTLGIEPNDLEIVLIETPRHDWGIRGLPADELNLDYKVRT